MLPELFFNGSIVKHRVCTGTGQNCSLMVVLWSIMFVLVLARTVL